LSVESPHSTPRNTQHATRIAPPLGIKPTLRYNLVMRILCTSAQLPGHLDWGGYLRTAAELRHRGHDVLWATGSAMVPFLQQANIPTHVLAETGWRWPPPPPLQPTPDIDPEALRKQRAIRALDQWLEEERVGAATAALIALGKAFRPDLFVSEVFLSAAGLAAEALGVPFAIAGWPAMRPKETGGQPAVVQEARERLARLCTRFGISGVNWTEVGPPAQQSPTLQISYWSPSWYHGVDLLPQTIHVGGSAPATTQTTPLPWPDELPWVFITLGTSFGKDANFFMMAAQAAVELGCLPILVLAGQFNRDEEATLRSRLPVEAVIEQRVDLNAVLPNVAAAIHHGGAGVTHALVTHGVPQIIVPHAADQFHQAQGIVRSGVGFYLPARETTVERLIDALAQVLPDLGPVRQNAGALRAEFAALGGVSRAAARLEELV
jgi:UDP:flavonoid glycosyltransferase YjiC (YdhE family)